MADSWDETIFYVSEHESFRPPVWYGLQVCIEMDTRKIEIQTIDVLLTVNQMDMKET